MFTLVLWIPISGQISTSNFTITCYEWWTIIYFSRRVIIDEHYRDEQYVFACSALSRHAVTYIIGWADSAVVQPNDRSIFF